MLLLPIVCSVYACDVVAVIVVVVVVVVFIGCVVHTQPEQFDRIAVVCWAKMFRSA